MHLIESFAHQEIEEVLRQLWVDEELSMKEMCEQLHITKMTLVKWREKAGIYSRRLNIDDGDEIPF